jgi:hypothetical protein
LKHLQAGSFLATSPESTPLPLPLQAKGHHLA